MHVLYRKPPRKGTWQQKTMPLVVSHGMTSRQKRVNAGYILSAATLVGEDAPKKDSALQEFLQHTENHNEKEILPGECAQESTTQGTMKRQTLIHRGNPRYKKEEHGDRMHSEIEGKYTLEASRIEGLLHWTHASEGKHTTHSTHGHLLHEARWRLQETREHTRAKRRSGEGKQRLKARRGTQSISAMGIQQCR